MAGQTDFLSGLNRAYSPMILTNTRLRRRLSNSPSRFVWTATVESILEKLSRWSLGHMLGCLGSLPRLTIPRPAPTLLQAKHEIHEPYFTGGDWIRLQRGC